MGIEPITIIGINPGTRYLGVAVLKGTQLREWRIKMIRGNLVKGKVKYLEGLLLKIIERYRPDTIALKKLHTSRTSKNLNRLVQAIRQCANENEIKLCEYSLPELETLLLQEGKANRWKLAEFVAIQYPVLNRVLRNELKRRNPYYVRMFEAVALAQLCLRATESWQKNIA